MDLRLRSKRNQTAFTRENPPECSSCTACVNGLQPAAGMLRPRRPGRSHHQPQHALPILKQALILHEFQLRQILRIHKAHRLFFWRSPQSSPSMLRSLKILSAHATDARPLQALNGIARHDTLERLREEVAVQRHIPAKIAIRWNTPVNLPRAFTTLKLPDLQPGTTTISASLTGTFFLGHGVARATAHDVAYFQTTSRCPMSPPGWCLAQSFFCLNPRAWRIAIRDQGIAYVTSVAVVR